MTFTVTYRGADGAVRMEAVEAASRGECFAQMKARGIAPMGVKEGNLVSHRERRGRKDELGKNSRVERVERVESRRGRDGRDGAGGKLFAVTCYLLPAIAVIAAIAWWWFGHAGGVPLPEEDGPKKPSALAKEVKPAAAPKPIPEQTAAKGKAETRPKDTSRQEERPRRVGEFRDGYVLLPSGELRKAAGIVTSVVVSTSIADTTFRHEAERSIAHLLLAEPGEGMLGDGESLYANFNEEFRESLKDEIAFSDEDTPSQRELKAAMIDIRKELIERMNRGEDLAKVMVETRRQLQELALYKNELAAQVEKLKKDGTLTKQDRLDLLEAANQMLEERGIKPFLIPSSLQHLIDIREAQKKESASQKGTPQ